MKLYKLILPVLLMCWSQAAMAANFLVTSNLDAGAGTLRAAILAANANG